MDGASSQQNRAIPVIRKQNQKNRAIPVIRKQNQKEITDDKPNSMPDIGINKLTDDMLIAILSGLNLKEAARTSVISRRWKYLWRSAIRNLRFADTGMEKRKFISWVNAVLKLYEPHLVDSLYINFTHTRPIPFGPVSSSTYHAIDGWICFALQKEVHRLGLDMPWSGYAFPNIEKMLSYSHAVESPFRSLRSLQLVSVDIEDEVVHYFLASCPHLEELDIFHSCAIKHLHVVDPPCLKVLEIRKCPHLRTLEVSAANLVSLAYEGVKNSLLLKKIPNDCELTLGNEICDTFISEPQAHSSNSVQPVKLRLEFYLRRGRDFTPPNSTKLCSLKRLELLCPSLVGRSLLYFLSFIKSFPQLREFRIEMDYLVPTDKKLREMMLFPSVSAAEAVNYDHKNLELVEMGGYVGSSSEDMFLVHLFDIASSLKKVVIDTQSDYYDHPDFELIEGVDVSWAGTGAATRIESKQCAERLASTFPHQIECIIK